MNSIDRVPFNLIMNLLFRNKVNFTEKIWGNYDFNEITFPYEEKERNSINIKVFEYVFSSNYGNRREGSTFKVKNLKFFRRTSFLKLGPFSRKLFFSTSFEDYSKFGIFMVSNHWFNCTKCAYYKNVVIKYPYISNTS